MKPHFYLSPESVWMYIEDCPEEPMVYKPYREFNPIVEYEWSKYEKEIALAKQSAVKCAEQEKVIKMFIVKHISFSPDSLYPVPEGIRVEVRTPPKTEGAFRKCIQCGQWGLSCKCALAYIVEEPKQEETINANNYRQVMDELVDFHLQRFTENNLFRASVENWLATGRTSGSFRAALHAMMEEYSNVIITRKNQNP